MSSQNDTLTYGANNRRIAKNTIVLYLRMFVMIVIFLYISRLVLNNLGIEDYGIYNVVGGVVTLFSMLSGSLSAAIGRFITVELGHDNKDALRKVFVASVNIQAMISFLCIMLLETIGLWFLNNKLIISESRIYAANWVFHFSVGTFLIGLLTVPFNAAVIAHEEMKTFAYISILDSLLKLVVAILITCGNYDRLILYSFLLFIESFVIFLLYVIYCRCKFSECRYSLESDKYWLKQIFSFAGWNFIGASSAVLRDQGGNIILNMFFGPAVNASRGLAMNVNSAVSSFVSNFMTALNPQITKSYARGDYKYMFELIFQGARFSYFILLIVTLPLFIITPYVLDLWLGVVPDHTIEFTRLVILFTLSESLANPLITAMLATGDIKKYQIFVGGCQLLNLPLSYLLFYWGIVPEAVFVVAIFVSVLCEAVRLVMLKFMINLSIRAFLKEVYFNVLIVTVVSSILPIFLATITGTESLGNCILLCLTSISSVILVVFTIGCNDNERNLVKSIVKNKFLNR